MFIVIFADLDEQAPDNLYQSTFLYDSKEDFINNSGLTNIEVIYLKEEL